MDIKAIMQVLKSLCVSKGPGWKMTHGKESVGIHLSPHTGSSPYACCFAKLPRQRFFFTEVWFQV